MMFDTFEKIDGPHKRKKLQCNSCRRETIHIVEVMYKGSWESEYFYGWHNYSLCRCGACDQVCFEKAVYFSENTVCDENGRDHFLPDETQYPAPSSADFAFDIDFTPTELNELIEELLYALAGSKLKLATVAIRMIIEFIVNDRECKGSNLYLKIKDLHKKNLIDSNQEKLLHIIREKGNASAHERISMNRNEMVAGISIINLLLEKLYNGPAREADIIKKANHAFSTETKNMI